MSFKELIINAGSSSLKYQVFEMPEAKVLAKGIFEQIGTDCTFTHKIDKDGEEVKVLDKKSVDAKDHHDAITILLETLTDKENGVLESMNDISAVGHRVLHGGAKLSGSVLVTDEVKAIIEECCDLGPLHNPANLMGIEACQAVMPSTPQVAVFDTAFHMTMPPKAYRYAIPTEYYENDSIRRYGFHGTSHKYVAKRTAELVGKKEFKMVNCHLGNGSSMSAVKDGKCQDTTMGLTPLAGVPMGTRSGDIDACVVQFICNKYNMSVDECLNMLNKKSGVLGVSGVSGTVGVVGCSFLRRRANLSTYSLSAVAFSGATNVFSYSDMFWYISFNLSIASPSILALIPFSAGNWLIPLTSVVALS